MTISNNLPQSYTADLTLTAITNGKQKSIKLSDYPDKYIILVFYPYDFTTVCPTEINALSDEKDAFDDLNAVVLLVSCDSIHTHAAWLDTPRDKKGIRGCRWPVVADYDRALTRYFNVGEEEGNCARATVVLRDGAVLWFSVGDKRMGRSTEEIRRVVRMARKIKKGGEYCECNWKKGNS